MDEKLDSDHLSKTVDRLVGERIKTRRVIMGISQQDFGDAIGVSLQQVQKYEKSVNRITAGRLFIAAKFLSVSVDYFFQSENLDVSTLQEQALQQPAVVAEDAAAYLPKHAINERELISLNKSFCDIDNAVLRKKVHDIVCMISDSYKQSK